MNDLERLRLLRDLLIKSRLKKASSLSELANQLESIVASIEQVPGALQFAYSTLWMALEVIGVQHHEAGTDPSAVELADLVAMVDRLRMEADAEIAARSG